MPCPWLPMPTHECQFKACEVCRPSMRDRAWGSIDGIVKGDIPATTLAGYGFRWQGARPVADARIVRNLGLRPNPPTRGERAAAAAGAAAGVNVNDENVKPAGVDVKGKVKAVETEYQDPDESWSTNDAATIDEIMANTGLTLDQIMMQRDDEPLPTTTPTGKGPFSEFAITGAMEELSVGDLDDKSASDATTVEDEAEAESLRMDSVLADLTGRGSRFRY